MTDKEKIRKEVQRLQNELIQEKKNGFGSDIDDACILELQNVLTFIDSLQEEPVNRTLADVESAMQEVEEKSRAFTEAHQGEDTDTILAQMRGEEPVSIDFEQELYKAFGQVKDFTLGMRIAKWFYDMGKNSPEPVCNDLEEAASLYVADDALKPWKNMVKEAFKSGAKWGKNKAKIEIQAQSMALAHGCPKVSVSKDLEAAVEWFNSVKYKSDLSGTPINAFKAGAKWKKKQMFENAISAELYSDGMLTPLIGVKDKEKLDGVKFGDKVKLIIIKDE